MNRFQKKLIKVFQILLVMGACVRAKSLRSHRTLGDPMGVGLPGSSVHGILQAWLLEQAAMPFSRDLPTQGSSTSPLHFLYWQADCLLLATPGKLQLWETWICRLKFQTWDRYVQVPVALFPLWPRVILIIFSSKYFFSSHVFDVLSRTYFLVF